jgi:hypothetical protein
MPKQIAYTIFRQEAVKSPREYLSQVRRALMTQNARASRHWDRGQILLHPSSGPTRDPLFRLTLQTGYALRHNIDTCTRRVGAVRCRTVAFLQHTSDQYERPL